MKRFVSLLLATIMVLSMVPALSFAAVIRTVYWDPTSGADTNDGLTEAKAVQSLAAAYAALEGADEGKIILLGTLSFTETTYFPACDIPVTITSKTGAEGIKSSKSICNHNTRGFYFFGNTFNNFKGFHSRLTEYTRCN